MNQNFKLRNQTPCASERLDLFLFLFLFFFFFAFFCLPYFFSLLTDFKKLPEPGENYNSALKYLNFILPL